MRILIDIGHPAHVHIFRNAALVLESGGHEILFTAREKDVAIELLEAYGLPYVSVGRPMSTRIGKLSGVLMFDWRLWRIARSFRPDLLLSHGSIYAAHVSALLRKPHVALEDTGNMEQVALYRPFTDTILTPSCLKDLGPKQLRHNSYHELAYLWPDYFEPKPSVPLRVGLEPGEKYAVIRFVAMTASHDAQLPGMNETDKIWIVRQLEKICRVLISSEAPLPQELEPFRIRLGASHIHSLLAFASLYYGQSCTMASESAVLGTPAILVTNARTCYSREQETKFGLVHQFEESDAGRIASLEKSLQLLADPHTEARYTHLRRDLLAEKQDMTALLVWFVENYPESTNGFASYCASSIEGRSSRATIS